MSPSILYGNEENLQNLQRIVSDRRRRFGEAPDTPIEKEPNVNKIARILHPKRQFLLITDTSRETRDVITYKLKPKNAGEKPAYFIAGQYLSFKLTIGDSHITRPYSISSSPGEALEGYYTVTIKKTQDGFASQYIHENWKVGKEVEASGPQGHFYYNELRDLDTVVCLAGGVGITPFYSMAKDIVDKNADFNMTILFGCKTEEEILFKNELMELERNSEGKLKVVFVLSEEKRNGYEHGFISADIIKKYSPKAFSVFICGPQVMYNFVNNELSGMDLSRKYIRREVYGQVLNVYEREDYPKNMRNEVFKLSLKMDDKTKVIPASANESILVAIERSGLKSSSCCRSGECGACRGRIISGNVYEIKESNAVRMADRVDGIVHSCVSYPLGDIEFELL